PGARDLPAGGGNPAALPGSGGTVADLPCTGGGTDSTRAGEGAPEAEPARARSAGDRLVFSWRVRPRSGALSAGGCPVRSAEAPFPYLPCDAGPGGRLPILLGLAPVAARPPRPGPAAEP